MYTRVKSVSANTIHPLESRSNVFRKNHAVDWKRTTVIERHSFRLVRTLRIRNAEVEDGMEERMEKLSVFRVISRRRRLHGFLFQSRLKRARTPRRGNVEFLGYWELVFDKRNGYRIHDDHLPDFFQECQFPTLVPIRIEKLNRDNPNFL